MKQRTLFAFCVVVGMTGFVAGQGRPVTNADLEKYRQERLQNEREYRENYARLGLPSPEEIDRRREQSFKDTAELSSKLRTQRLESERIEVERQANEWNASPAYGYNQNTIAPQYPQYYEPPYFYSYGYSYGLGGRGRGRFRTPFQQSGYVGGGQFWPTGNSTPSRPMFVRPRATPRR